MRTDRTKKESESHMQGIQHFHGVDAAIRAQKKEPHAGDGGGSWVSRFRVRL
jgi:hypothetical protein